MKISDGVKALVKEDLYFYTGLIILVAVLSFGLGRLSMQQTEYANKQPQVVLTAQPAAVVAPTLETKTSAEMGQLVASKKGTKYHLLTCPGAKQISEENKIYFNSEAEAAALGYAPAANCDFE